MEGIGVAVGDTVVLTGDGVGLETGVAIVTGKGAWVTEEFPVLPPGSGFVTRKTPATTTMIMMANTPASWYPERFGPGDVPGEAGVV